MSETPSAENDAPCRVGCGHPPADHDENGECMHLCDCAWPSAENDVSYGPAQEQTEPITNPVPAAEDGLPVITRYFIPESSQARLRINCPNCTSEWGWCIDTPTNEAILQGLVATHVRQGCIIPPAEKGEAGA